MTEALRRHVDAFNDRDLEALLAGFTDDAVWVTGGSVVHGRKELAELFSDALEQLLPTLTIENVIADGDRVAAQLTEQLTHNGVGRQFSIAGFYRFEGGRIASAKIYREGNAELAWRPLSSFRQMLPGQGRCSDCEARGSAQTTGRGEGLGPQRRAEAPRHRGEEEHSDHKVGGKRWTSTRGKRSDHEGTARAAR
ncbi:hypothetical protein GCM10022222_70910 [Amycolatopsis ultiminotia]|uniref:SnoaL-like domain-containing protein n=1 Tax=Amycolatopsis ultiminotia TaxID=543629 RepID=A0ABP6Y218_9PSEU